MAASPATTPKKAVAARVVAHAEVSREMQGESFEFRIRNFSSQPHVVGELFLSPDFELCGHKWSVVVYPGGITQENAGWLSVLLYNKGDAITADYKFELFAGVPSADSVPIWSSGFRNQSFLAMGALFAQGKSDNWGVPKTLQRDDLISRTVDDTITLRVTVRAGRASSTVTIVQCAAATRHPEPAHKTLRDFGALLETGDGSDVVLRADGRDFKAHKVILSARSRVLRAMFGGRFKEGIRSTTSATSASSSSTTEAESKNDGVVEVGEVDAETLGRMLRFIYTGSVASSSAGDAAAGGGDEEEEEGADAVIGVSGWMRLLSAADRFDVGDLFEVAQWRLAEMLTTTTASSSSSSASTTTEQRQRNALECLGLATQLPMGAEALKTAALDVLVRDGVPDDAELTLEMSKEIMKHLNVLRPAAKPQSDEEEEEEEEPAAKRRASAGRGGRRSRK